ncbi:hypothetical protein GCM10028862_16700 [Luteimonas pelagia]
MSNEILDAVREHGEKFERELKALDGKLSRELDDIAQKMETAGSDAVRGKAADPLMEAIGSDEFKALRTGRSTNAKVEVKGGLKLLAKAVVGDAGSSNDDPYNVQDQRLAGVYNDPRRRLSVLNALSHMRVSKDTITFNRLDGYTAAADYQLAQGDAKPETAMPTTLTTVNIAQIAHFVKASNQVLADEPALRSQMASLMQYGALAKLEAEILLGDGTTGNIGGLTLAGNHTAHVAASGDNLADAVSKAKANLEAAGWRAGLVIVNPITWGEHERTREGADGMYLFGGAASGTWGIPVVTSPFLAQGEFIVLDPSQVVVLDRDPPTVEAGYVNDDFTRNLTTLRAELRAGLMVMAAGAVIYGDIEL